MKKENLLILAGLGIAGYLIYKYMAGNTGAAASEAAQTGGGGSIINYTLPEITYPNITYPTITVPMSGDNTTGNNGTDADATNKNEHTTAANQNSTTTQGIIQTPTGFIVPMKNTIPSKIPGVQNFPTLTISLPKTVYPFKPAVPKPPLKITNMFGFPVIPHIKVA